MRNTYCFFQKTLFTNLNALAKTAVLLILLSTVSILRAEGIQDVAPSSSDIVMLLIGDENYANFAVNSSAESSRLYIQFSQPGEILYLGLSREYNEGGSPAGTGSYSYVIKRASDGTVAHGPYSINGFNENLSSWDQAIGPAVLNGGIGYETDHARYNFTADEPGLYYIEFTSANYIGLWDFTMAYDGVEIPGRVFSKNWAFRTPKDENLVPECVWDREFNGALYSYTSDGFVTHLDFENSGFQGLSFTMAFNSRGPGDTGDINLDRKSIPNSNIGEDFAEHLVFLSEPDPTLFPNGECGDITVAPYFQCTSDDAYCLDLTVTQPGQLEVVIDVNNNNVYEEGIDRRILHRFNEGDDFNHCLYWDGLLGDGTVIDPGARVNLLIKYTQGIQHWSVFDAEFLKDGFCVEPIRPICNAGGGTDFLHWDDRDITEDPGTGQPKDGTNGCDCETLGCRTWSNFDPHTDDCEEIDDNITTGYGDKSVINTWWFANVEELTLVNVPLVFVEIIGETQVCEDFAPNLSFEFTSAAAIANVIWTGPNGIIAQGVDAPSTIQVDIPGLYSIEITDVNGCTYSDTHEIDIMTCSTDLELDITANNTSPQVCDTVDFTISISNIGDMEAGNIQMSAYWDEAINNIHNISHGGQWNGNTIVWDNLNLIVGEGVIISFSAKVLPSFDYVISAEITDFPQGDTDSTPNNGVDTDDDGVCADDDGDEDDGDCVVLTPPDCNIQVSITNLVCNPNETFEVGDDDTFTFDLTVTGSNGDEGWTGQVGGQTISGNYGDTQSFGPFDILNGDIDIALNDDFFTTTCTTAFTIPAPNTCSDQCVISVEEGDIICSDNGTSDDASDDTYTINFRLSGFNTGTGWVASDGSGGAYNTWFTYGPYAISEGGVTLTFFDADTADCSVDYTFSAPETCSSDCSIAATLGQAICSDNGTPSDDSDDTFTFTVNVNGFNTSAAGWVANDALASTGAYDTDVVMGPYLISQGDVSFQLMDADEVNCLFAVNVQAPNTCSDLCDISLEQGEIICLDSGTLSDPSDDMFTIEVRLTGLNTANQWTASNGATGNYNEWVTLGPFLIDAGDVSLNFTDNTDANCSVNANFEAPLSCSNNCEINTTVSNTLCTDNGTPSDPSDDSFSFILTVTGSNTAVGWTADDVLGSQGSYSTAVLMGPYAISAGAVTITITDNDNSNCTSVINVEPSATCSNLCSNTVSQTSDAICDDNGTPTIAEDDLFSFAVVVSGANIAGEWTASNGQTGAYNEPVVLEGFTIADGTAVVTFTDNDDPNCTSIITVNAPSSCSVTCDITSLDVSNIACNDNGTPVDPTDDTFTFTVFVDGLNTASQWTTTSGESGAYGENIQFGPYLISDGTVSLEFIDIDDNLCTSSTTIEPPASCSNECAIEALISNIQCWDNGTSFDAGDDVYTFDLLVTASNHTGDSWVYGELSGNYGAVQNQGPFLIADGSFDMLIEDVDDPSCTTSLTVMPPATCSDDCLLSVEVISTFCDDLGTELDASDDLFSYTIRVTGANGGTSWTASDGTTGAYGVDVQSVGVPYADGALNIIVTDDFLGCVDSFTVIPPDPSLLCPPDTDERNFTGSIQVIRGYLGDSLDFVVPDPPCILGLHSTPMTLGDRFMEPIDVNTPGPEDTTDVESNVYTFYFFSDIEPPNDEFPYNADGSGGLFRGDYMSYADPCCFNINYPDTINNDGDLLNNDLIIENPFIDTSQLSLENMHLVQRFTHSLKTNQNFSLVASTFGAEATGNYAWVIVSEEEDSMTVNSDNVTSEFYPDEIITEDLTFLLMGWIQDYPIASQEYVGSPIVEPYCGADSLFLNDNLIFDDSCELAIIQRSYYLTYGDQIDSCHQNITFRKPEYDDIVLPPATVTLECGDDYPVNTNGFPDPLATGYPLLSVEDEYVPMYDTASYFNLATSYKDIPQFDTSGLALNLVREWTITDFCTGDTLYVIPQLIKIGDFLLPTIRCVFTENCNCPNAPADLMLYDVDAGDCTGTIDIPEPIISGFCNEVEGEDRLEDWFVITELLLASDSSHVDSLYIDENRSISNLVRGDYIVRYSMEDAFGRRVERICDLRIADFQVPTAICKTSDTILLSEIQSTRVFPEDIDQGSYDNCDLPSLEIRRFYDDNSLSCEFLNIDEEGYGDWSPYVDFNCCDQGESYLVELRVMDLDSNLNGCNTLIEVVDDVAPVLYGLQDREVTCSELPFAFDPTDSLQLVELFGYPQVDDNCLEMSWELEPVLNWNDCELGSIHRRFQAIDRAGNSGATTYDQFITIAGDQSYGIRFSADKITVCLEDEADLAFSSRGCGVFDINFQDTELPAESGECARIQRVYSVINTCDYDGVSPAVEISRNEDCDGLEGEEDIWLLIEGNLAYIDADSLANNTFPIEGEQGVDCNSGSNPQGYWRSVANVGYWTYTQLIIVHDENAPMIEYTTPEPFCSIDERCEALVTIPVKVFADCVEEKVDISLWWDQDADGTLDEDLTETNVLDGARPDYILQGDFPLGSHAFVLIARDDCNNETTERIDFDVVDCYIELPICKPTFEIQLNPIVPAVDLNGDGILDEGAYIQAAGQLVEEMLPDCSADYSYSVNKIGQGVDFTETNLILTCEDRYTTMREVVVKDNAFNPYAIQPDGSVGGPNYKTCTIEISVQDEAEVCSACVENELEIEGIIITPSNQPISDVEVRLFQEDQFTGEQFTIQDGKFEFTDLELSTDFEVKPYKNDDTTNGVTTIDLIILQKHLLLIEEITDPYILLAADVNASGTVTILDLLLIQELLLGHIEEFPSNTSWRFIPADFPLTDIAAEIPDSYSYNNLITCQFAQDFIGIKIGDLNGSSSLSNGIIQNEIDSRSSWPICINEVEMDEGGLYNISIDITDIEKISGVELNFEFDLTKLSIVEIEPGLIAMNQITTKNLDRGMFKGIWLANNITEKDDNTLLTLLVRAEQNALVSEVFNTHNELGASIVYDQALLAYNTKLLFGEVRSEAVLLDNSPDPFIAFTNIEFYLPKAGEYLLEIHDVNGKLLRSISKQGVMGVQKIKLQGDQLSPGVHYYTLTFDRQIITRRMVKF